MWSSAYSRLRRHSYAIRDCTQAIVLQPTNAEAYYLRGLARIELNEVDLAITDLEEARRLEPTRADDVAAVINKAVKLDSPQPKSAVTSRSESER